MNKTVKKLLITIVFIMTIFLFKNTSSFAYILNEKDAFDTFKKEKYETEYTLYVGEKMFQSNYSVFWYLKPTINVSNSKVVEVKNETEIVAKKTGNATVKITVSYEGKTVTKKFKIKVTQTKESTKLDSKTNDIVSISESAEGKNQILLANSELWNAKDKSYKLTNKKAGNVAKYVYAEIYEDRYSYTAKDSLRVEATLKKDGNLTIKYPQRTINKKNYKVKFSSNKTKKETKVKDISNFGYLKNNGQLYFYDVNKNGQLQIQKRLTGVKEILSDYIVTKKGKTYAISGKKICDFEAVQVDLASTCRSGMLLDKKGQLYFYKYDDGYKYVNGKYKKVSKESYIVKKVEKNVKTIIGNGKYKTKKGKEKQYNVENLDLLYGDKSVQKSLYLENNELKLKINNKVYLNDTKILDKVDDIHYANGTKNKSALLVRKDGSIWKLDIGGKAKLTKIRSGKDKYKKISAPTNVKATKTSNTSVKVKWSKVEGATKYTIYRATSKNGNYKKVATSNTNSFKDTKLKKGTTYYYKVVANSSNSKYNSNKSSSAKIKLSK